MKFKKFRRFHNPGDAHSINFTCFRNRLFLQRDRSCEWFRESLCNALEKYHCSLWAFCIMPDHVHVLIYPKKPEFDVATFLSDLKQPVTRRAISWIKRNAPLF